MKITDSEFSKHIISSKQIKLGDIYFFTHIAVIEFNDGVHIDINNFSAIFEKLVEFFGISKPFGVISNRINSYSINLLHMNTFKEQMNNLCAYAVISHNSASAMNAEIESNFCSSENIHFHKLNQGVNFVYNKVQSQILISLN